MISSTPDFEWQDYFEAAEKNKLHHLFEKLQPHLRPGLTALELGCGVGHGTAHLYAHGLEVTAVDIYKEALNRVRSKLPACHRVQLVERDFRQLAFPEQSFDMIVAINALYFLSPIEFSGFWARLGSWIRPGGLFVGNFMGPGDPWAFRKDYNTQSEETLRTLLDGFDVLYQLNDERDTVITTGKTRHVHVLHVLARKRGPVSN